MSGIDRLQSISEEEAKPGRGTNDKHSLVTFTELID
jgi:hypothetical protein